MKKLLTAFFFIPLLCAGQTEPNPEILPIRHHEHQLIIMIGHVYVPKAVELGSERSNGIALPIWSLGYNYHIHEGWVVGLHTDITVQSFEVEKGSEDAVIERSYPIAPAIMVGHKVLEHGTILLGGGYEIERNENFALARAGLEWGYEFLEKFEVSGALEYDYRFEAYDSFSIMFGISYLW